jgi:hypothetical protein
MILLFDQNMMQVNQKYNMVTICVNKIEGWCLLGILSYHPMEPFRKLSTI